MGKKTRIGWAHHTHNPVRGCRHALLADGSLSPACSDGSGVPKCYAEAWSHRNPRVLGTWGAGGTRVFASESYLRQPFAWDKEAAADGKRCSILGHRPDVMCEPAVAALVREVARGR